MKFLVRVAGMVCVPVVLLALFGSSTASADAYAGKTYAEAAAKIAEKNGKAIIATVTGSQLDTNDCTVVSSSTGIFLDSSGVARKKEYYLNLNCNQRVASPGHPGNSVTTPAGLKEKNDEVVAAKIAKDPELPFCATHAEYCQKICDQTKMCKYTAS